MKMYTISVQNASDHQDKNLDKLLREAFIIKKWIYNNNDQICGRGSEQKQNFMKIEK